MFIFQNSVNLYTGEIAFPLPLVTLPGRGGLTAGVALSYNSSGVQQQARMWNLTAPTGTVGLGWRLDVPKIVVDHKQTGTRHDDEFYLVEGGTSNRLITTASSGRTRTFKAENYQFSYIQYDELTETWIIKKADGTRFIYGNKGSGRSTVQYLVRWDNWIGNSINAVGQSQQAMQWDLSAIENRWGDAVTFTYRQVRQRVGKAGKEHTEASYLTQIANPQGQSIFLEYGDKFFDEKRGKDFEYQEPHTEQKEPDAYQERYEKEYLRAIKVFSAAGLERYRMELDYTTMGSGNFYKRLLTRIQKVVDNNNKLAPVEFAYHLSGEKAGLMEMVTTSQGPQVSYMRTTTTVEGSERDLTISAPAGYAEPQTWIGPDYVAVAWRKFDGTHTEGPQDVKMRLYQWQGRWVESKLSGNVSTRASPDGTGLYDDILYRSIGLEANRYRRFQVKTGKDFMAVLYPTPDGRSSKWSVDLFHQDAGRPGVWIVKRNQSVLEWGDVPATLLLGDSFVAAGTPYRKLLAFTFDGDEWQSSTLHDQAGDFFYTSANNYIIAHNNDLNPDKVTIHYLNEIHQWKSRDLPSSQSYQTGKYNRGDTYWDVASFWHGGNSSAVWMADAHAESILHWDTNYNLTLEGGYLGYWSDAAPVLITDEMISIMPRSSGSVPIVAYRFDGQTWHTSNQVNSYNNGVGITSSLGGDFLAFPRVPNGDSAQIRSFDPNTLEWKSQHIFKTDYNVHDQTYAGANYVAFGDQYYYRNPDGEWKLAYTVPSYNGWNQAFFFAGGYQLTTVSSSPNTYVNYFENGQMQVHTLTNQSLFKGFNRKVNVNGDLIGSNIVITFPSSVSAMENARVITLHKLVNNELTGKQTIYPVTLVNVHDGFVRQPTSYEYKTDLSSVMMANGASAQFSEVKVVPGSYSPGVIPYGYMKHYFFNGLDSTLVQEPFPVTGNAPDYRGKLAGVTYAVKSYDSQDNLVAESRSAWQVYAKNINATPGVESDTFKVAQGYFARVVNSSQTQDGVTRITTTTYDKSAHGQITQMSTTDSEGRTRLSKYRYATDFSNNTFGSNLLRDRGIVSPALEQTVEVDGQVVQKSESYYELQHGQPVPVRTVVYPDGSGKSITTRLAYDQYGNLIQSQSEGGLTSAFLYGYRHTFPVLEAVGATYSELSEQVSISGIQDMDGSGLQDELNKARTGLSKALIVTRTFDKLYGPTSETDPRGRTTYTSYDALGRLDHIKDHEGHVRQKIEYSPYIMR